MDTVQPFRIDVPDETLDDLRRRLAATRWPDEITGAGWDYGTDLAYLKALVSHWERGFDWRAQETALNRFAQFRADVDGTSLHYVHERGRATDALPIVLLHGWPSSFWQMSRLVPLLSDPARYGGDAADAFDVVAPSLPGYGFSSRPTEPGVGVARVAELLAELLTERLGYRRVALRASDMGAGVAQQLALAHPELVVGLHLSGTSPYLGELPDDLTPAEQKFVADAQRWWQEEMAYAMVHATRPQTLAYALNDSPAGLAAWLVEKFRLWSDSGGEVERRFSKDDLLTNLTIYWATETIGSSTRLYYESVRNPGRRGRVEAPTAMLMSSKDMFQTPREWAERSYRVTRWTETSRGGHFLEWEEPELVAEDVKSFFRPLRGGGDGAARSEEG